MKLTNSAIRNLIKKELLNLQERRIQPGMQSPTHSGQRTGAGLETTIADERKADADRAAQEEAAAKAACENANPPGTWSNGNCIPGGDLKFEPNLPPPPTAEEERETALDRCNRLYANDGKALEDCLLKIQGMAPETEGEMAQLRKDFKNRLSAFETFGPTEGETFEKWFRAIRKPMRELKKLNDKYKKLTGEEIPEYFHAMGRVQKWIEGKGWQKKWDRRRKGRRGKTGRRLHRLTRKGLKILDDKGFKDFDDFYAELEKHNLMYILDKHGGADKKWGPAHGTALDKVLDAMEDAPAQAAEEKRDSDASAAEEKLIDDHHEKLALDAAKKVFQLIDGATYPSEKREAHAVIKDLEEKGIDLAKLYDAYSRHLRFINDPDQDEDLVQWLKSDGMNSDARKIADAVRAHKEKEAAEEDAKPKPRWDKTLRDKQKASEEGDYDDRKKRLGLGDTNLGGDLNLQENTVYSSYSDSQKLFESWKRFTKSTKED